MAPRSAPQILASSSAPRTLAPSMDNRMWPSQLSLMLSLSLSHALCLSLSPPSPASPAVARASSSLSPPSPATAHHPPRAGRLPVPLLSSAAAADGARHAAAGRVCLRHAVPSSPSGGAAPPPAPEAPAAAPAPIPATQVPATQPGRGGWEEERPDDWLARRRGLRRPLGVPPYWSGAGAAAKQTTPVASRQASSEVVH
ncbi:predicted GPI-anchored protein 58 [Miscanthus floridulus]|uniref:predicted GPI-anchored protein 58 n=1 Tax=Miscanthus floridulus TaxID=154761 RepID=UPI003457DE1D